MLLCSIIIDMSPTKVSNYKKGQKKGRGRRYWGWTGARTWCCAVNRGGLGLMGLKWCLEWIAMEEALKVACLKSVSHSEIYIFHHDPAQQEKHFNEAGSILSMWDVPWYFLFRSIPCHVIYFPLLLLPLPSPRPPSLLFLIKPIKFIP